VRVIFTDNIADDARAFLVGFVVSIAEFVHGPQHTSVHRFQTITHIRQRAADDYRHGVVEIRTPHLVFDVYVMALRGCFHSLAFQVQFARTQFGPTEEILSSGLAVLFEQKKRGGNSAFSMVVCNSDIGENSNKINSFWSRGDLNKRP
jgi:hypothetical protein